MLRRRRRLEPIRMPHLLRKEIARGGTRTISISPKAYDILHHDYNTGYKAGQYAEFWKAVGEGE